ncbi:cohesin domain-containing protein [Herbivorax sp. ANBcel31]|uniref:cohesin domain-containing protein n=1 Tax=Herbivorax sp. ANBcel31 TaxID=3069754 RepID=UPI0027B3E0B4|nr:cohesin domain-containing protein [Herbivorax sp. ANBcel31]MDQ2085905.1 cohesin domain-containing protein [Herbivorax sp. ANBcel31]
MKKIILGLIAGVVLSTGIFALAATGSWTAVAPNFDVLVRGEIFEPEDPAVVIDGRTYLPLRAMSEALDVDIDWDGDAREVHVDMEGYSQGSSDEVVEHEDITMGSDAVEASPGETITIPVKFSNVPSEGINSGNLRISFDNEKIELTGIEGGDIINNPENDLQYNIMNEEGAVTLLYVEARQLGEGMIDTDGVFITIEAEVKEDALDGVDSDSLSAEFTIDESKFEDYDFNEIGVIPSLGEIEIKK